MPVPTSIADLEVDEALNYPVGSDVVGGSVDDYFRAHAAIIKRQFVKSDSINSASNLAVPADGAYINVLAGTQTTISSIANSFDGRAVWLRFAAGITVRHSSSLTLPGNQNWVTANGDTGLFMQDSPGVWRCLMRSPMGTAALADVQTSVTDDTAGRLMVVGAFGIGGNEIALSNANLHEPRPSGLYYSTGVTNSPPGANTTGHFLVMTRSNVNFTVIYRPYDSTDVWVDSLSSNGTWVGWTRLDSANTVALPSGYNLNNLTAPGKYRIEQNAQAGPNAPGAGTVEVMNWGSNDQVMQRWTKYNGEDVQVRTYYIAAGGWTIWTRCYSTSNITVSTGNPSGGADGDIWLKV